MTEHFWMYCACGWSTSEPRQVVRNVCPRCGDHLLTCIGEDVEIDAVQQLVDANNCTVHAAVRVLKDREPQDGSEIDWAADVELLAPTAQNLALLAEAHAKRLEEICVAFQGKVNIRGIFPPRWLRDVECAFATALLYAEIIYEAEEGQRRFESAVEGYQMVASSGKRDERTGFPVWADGPFEGAEAIIEALIARVRAYEEPEKPKQLEEAHDEHAEEEDQSGGAESSLSHG